MVRGKLGLLLAGALGLGLLVSATATPAMSGEPRAASSGESRAAYGETGEPATPAAEPSLSQQIDGWFAPFARKASDAMFWDPFAAVGLYDPVVYDDEGRPVLDANGEPRKTQIPLVVIWLVAAALYFTLRMRFINVRGFIHAVALIRGKFTQHDAPGEVSHFQALATAVSGTVGLGNIAGVAIAITLGGPGATFWMAAAGFFGMATKFAECTLGVKYRTIDADGRVAGGPMYYLSKGFAGRRLGGLSLAPVGAVLAGVWAFLAILGSLGGGNMFQANQSFAIAAEMLPFLQGNGAYFGMVLAALVAVVIVGGIQGIGKITGKLVPFMALLYVAASLVIIFANITRIGDVFVEIMSGAFSADAAKGGFIGVMVIGLRRAAFSNEAGVGTAAIAHSAAKTPHPIAEGIVGLHEPFIDTVVICSLTGLVLVFTGYHEAAEGLTGSALTSAAFGSVISWFPYVLTVAILLFSFSTLISFAYYGQQCFDYCFGWLSERLFGTRRPAVHVYRVVFLLCTVVGASSSVTAVLDYSDMIIFGLAFTNTFGLFVLSSEVRADMKSYFARLKSGAIRPTRS